MHKNNLKKSLIKLQDGLSAEVFLFSILLILQIFFFSWLIFSKRIPGGHDGFQYFVLQYYFLNDTVISGEIPQWMPFMTQGTVASWWYFVQASLFQNTLMLAHGLLKSINFMICFNAGMFVDELLLMIGSWLLARRFLQSPLALFFTVASILSSCVWMTQPWYNFHFYYAIPLILHFGHRFLETGRWRYFFFAGNLLTIQMLGNLPYFLPLISLVIFLYFIFYGLFQFDLILNQLKRITWNFKTILCILGILSSLVGVYVVLSSGTDQIVNYNYGRELDISTTIDGFLSYAGNFNLHKWEELFIGISPALDFTLYGGLFIIPMIIFGLVINAQRRNFHFVFLILILISISVGSKVAALFYYIWPLMKFYRHLTLISPIIKLLLCFLAGFGFDALINNVKHRKYLLILSALIIFSILLTLLNLQNNFNDHLTNVVSTSSELPILMKTRHPTFQILRIERSFMIAAVFILVIFCSYILHRKNLGVLGIIFLLTFHTWDIYSYKFSEASLRTLSLTDSQIELTKFQPMPFSKFRETAYPDNNARYDLVTHLPTPGQQYWSNSSFAFFDDVGSAFRTDHWLLPLDNFMRAYWKQPIDNLKIKPKGLFYYYHLSFPSGHVAAGKFAAATYPKIQFFSDAHLIYDPQRIATLISNDTYAGDILFLSAHNNLQPQKNNSRSHKPKGFLQDNERLAIPFDIKNFSSNTLELEMNVPNNKNVWLMYSDVWHPNWKAFNNGHQIQLERANLAYKAIQLMPGKNKITFKFFSPLLNFFQWFWCWISLCWVGGTIYLALRICTRDPNLLKHDFT
ncbi:MAG: hypothetical protein H6753_04620 [Candidatus Omnitrophica bacterium]|nr:hypothetical protein [Candidatus Omnitrophota bacterium]